MHPIAKQIIGGDTRACAKAITWIEEEKPEGFELLRELTPYTGRAVTVGITGAPGAGKSTLVDALISLLRGKGFSLGIIAVDPTSPFTGGAILGDRIRMQRHATDRGVFIRSMGTRGNLGGLSYHTQGAMQILDAYGCDVILVETVGVGQSEVKVMEAVDTTLLVLSPGTGDVVQAFKAGIMEIADLFVVNKADLPGTEKLVAQVNAMLDITKTGKGWRPPVLKTVGSRGEGILMVWEKILEHRASLEEEPDGETRRRRRRMAELKEILRRFLDQWVEELLSSPDYQGRIKDVEEGKESPYFLAGQILNHLKRGGGGE
ncbi:methylmalonyl Co-A mutase-associated GTPase MeaB [Thermicanus aegyptius]|uniref:methylmalonyl Co-A mutase-associated GTPase MeaB n=1 Tax=Thermicanus aegyptius TaxID=94009 RepID=UPI0003FF6FA1|nr:methylmalonyl Co-A mutase-associated GTPase MeaB [Thermicanus aegyptius]